MSQDREVPQLPRASGVGPWPGDDPLEAARQVFGALAEPPGLVFLPQLPGRGPGADPLGRALSMLVDLPSDLQPSGWRLVERPGRDLQRAKAYLSADTDALAEAADGYEGSLMIGVNGPWTLAGKVWLPRGERVATDAGASRDLCESLADGLAQHVETVRRLVPGAQVTVLLDEPGLPAALGGRLPTMSGFGRLRPIEASVAEDALTRLIERVRSAGARELILRCAVPEAPLPLLRRCGPDALALNVSTLTPRGWEGVAVAVEDGLRFCAGVVQPEAEPLVDTAQLLSSIVRPWRQVGLPAEDLTWVDVLPTGGLADVSPDRAREVLRRGVSVAEALAETAHE